MSNNLYEANLGCYKLKENAKLPTKGSHHAACYDLYSCSEAPIVIDPKERMLIPIGLVLDIPRGFSARIHTRSGMAAKKGIGLSVSQGIIDSDYVEEVFVPMVNNTNKSFTFTPVIVSHNLNLFVKLLLMFMKPKKDLHRRPTVRAVLEAQANETK